MITSKLLELTHRAAIDSGSPELLIEIQSACHKKQAFCFMSDDSLIVLRPRMKDGIPYVVVWLGVSTRSDGLVRHTPAVQELTRQIGGRWAEFYTVRKGFIRIAKRLGFERKEDEGGLMKFVIPV